MDKKETEQWAKRNGKFFEQYNYCVEYAAMLISDNMSPRAKRVFIATAKDMEKNWL